MIRRLLPGLGRACLLLLFLVPEYSLAQQASVGTPLRGASSGFFEHFGIGFGVRHVSPHGMMFFQHGNGMSALPPFGGFDASAASTFGIGGRNGDWSWNLNVSAIQGYGSSNVTTTPSLTLPNGGFGFIQNTVQRPFVTSFQPVVNGLNIAQQRRVRLQQYERAAQRFLEERRLRQQSEEAEFQRMRIAVEEAREKKGYSSKQPEPALILGSTIPSADSD